MKLIKIGAIVALLAVAACAGTPEVRGTNALAIACSSYATVLDQLTPIRAKGKISAANAGRVDAANKLVAPACSKDAVINPAEAIGVVKEGIALLNSVKDSL